MSEMIDRVLEPKAYFVAEDGPYSLLGTREVI